MSHVLVIEQDAPRPGDGASAGVHAGVDHDELTRAGYQPHRVQTADAALAALANAPALGVALVDHRLHDDQLPRTLTRARDKLELVLLVDAATAPDLVPALGEIYGDFVTLPSPRGVLPLRIAAAANRRRQRLAAQLYEMSLEERVVTRTREVWEKNEALKQQFLATIEALEAALESKHEYTEGHSRRVALVSVRVARELGLPAQTVEHIRLAALFHDIGKIGIRDNVLNKQGPLTDEEFEHIKEHPLIAERILGPLDGFGEIIDMIKYEHERYDGTGYPYKIAGETIPLGARIIAVADAYDALVTTRSYRRGTTIGHAIREIRRNAGTQFDPRAVEALARVFGRTSARVAFDQLADR